MIKERKRVRLENYNYSKAGFYFLTLCIKDKEKILCEIVGDGGAGVRWTPLRSRSTDRGGSREHRRPLQMKKFRIWFQVLKDL